MIVTLPPVFIFLDDHLTVFYCYKRVARRVLNQRTRFTGSRRPIPVRSGCWCERFVLFRSFQPSSVQFAPQLRLTLADSRQLWPDCMNSTYIKVRHLIDWSQRVLRASNLCKARSYLSKTIKMTGQLMDATHNERHVDSHDNVVFIIYCLAKLSTRAWVSFIFRQLTHLQSTVRQCSYISFLLNFRFLKYVEN